MSWASFISAGVGAWAKKGAAALGVGVVSYVGWGLVKDEISNAVTGALSGMGGSVYQVVALAGLVDAVGIWLGALTTAVSLMAIKRLGVLNG